ncbi:MAG: thiamine phosphate synthase [Clostridia bacterium]|nr:thiamine phosphate synthase [Clostridia bacterium]
MKLDKSTVLLYVITDRKLLGEHTIYTQVEEALKGGATIIQLREKNLGDEEFLNEAVLIKEICRKYNVPLIINDNVQVALKSGADGVHVGQDDMKAENVRKLIGGNKILGVSAHSVEEAILAEKNGADYLGVGAIFTTSSKADVQSTSIDTLKEICSTVRIPVVAIGGITSENIKQLSGSSVSGAALISAVFGQSDVRLAAEKLKNLIEDTV